MTNKGWQGKPNPGSDAALNMGCTCAVMDNNHGKWAPWPPSGWWITGGCPLHDSTEAQERAKIDTETGPQEVG